MTFQVKAVNDHKARGILIGALAGALLGAAIGWVYASRADGDEAVNLTPGDYFKLGIALLGVARQVGDLVQRS